MKMPAGLPLDSKYLRHAPFIGVNLALIGAFLLLVVLPLRQFLDERAESLVSRRASLARYEAIIAREGAVEDYARIVEESNARGELLQGANEGLIGANLQARLKELSDAAGVTLRSTQILPPKTLRGVKLFGARIEVSGLVPQVHALVRGLEGDSPLLLVLSANLRGSAATWGFLQQQQQPTEQPIEVQFDVYGGAPSKGRA